MQMILPQAQEEKRKLGVLIGTASLILIGVGVFILKAGEFESPVKISLADTASGSAVNAGRVWVDIEGAVARPGVYQLDQGARIDQVVAAAGGLTAEADREWVDKNVNKAQVVADGYKLYIPGKGQTVVNPLVAGAQSKVISVNSASQIELESLPGIGPVTANKIIQGRPYTRLEELQERKIVGQKVWEEIKGQLALW